MSRPKYFRARKSHCWYTNNWHLYVFPWQKHHHAMKTTGFTIKQRLKNGWWRHYTFRIAAGKDTTRLFHAEAVTHLSEKCSAERKPLTKKYIRLKIRV